MCCSRGWTRGCAMTDVPIGRLAPVAGVTAPKRIELLTVRQLTWRKFKRNRLALLGMWVLIVMYAVALFAGFLAPYGDRETHDAFARSQPIGLNFIDETGAFRLVPFAYGFKRTMDPKTFKQSTTADTSQKYPLQFFVRGAPYTILGVIRSDIHL